MGACASSDSSRCPTEKFNFEASYRNKYTKLSNEHSTLIKYVEENVFDRGNEIDNEQINILKYKIELLLTILAMEDKSKDVINGRMEAMKCMLVSEGQSAQYLEELFSQYNTAHSPSTIDLNYDIDIANAIEMTRNAFEKNHVRDEIVQAFVDEEGTLRLSVSREEFVERLEATTTIHLPTKDLQVLSLRFFDGLMVSVPEFLSFFGNSSKQRLVRSASHAVTVTQENIDINIDLSNSMTNFVISPNSRSTTNQVSMMDTQYSTKELNVSVMKLIVLWMYVKEALLTEFENRRTGTSRTLSVAQFSVRF